jgi:tetratricopeptide (TPR) repeat protein
MIRPQPLGIFPYPAGLLLLPDPAADDVRADGQDALAREALQALLRGGTPDWWPESWAFYAAALAGDRDGALALLPPYTDATTSYNRYVLSGNAGDRDYALAISDDTICALTNMAAFVLGDRESPPSVDVLDGELAAHGQLIVATAHLEHGDTAGAMAPLEKGSATARAVSPLLAAQLLSQRAALEEPSAASEQLLRDAIALVGDTALTSLTAELWCALALVVHQRAEESRHRLVEAAQCYQQALRTGVSVETHPELWARIQVNLGLIYVAMPMSEQGEKLRLAVAVQAFREALRVYTRESHPHEWASTMLNMANAMQYLPSAKQAENLADAVTAYEELLSVRPKEMDPVGYARILANQGNALAHLGIFGPAVEKLTESHKLLHWYGESDAAQRLLAQLEQINTQLAVAGAAASDATGAP